MCGEESNGRLLRLGVAVHHARGPCSADHDRTPRPAGVRALYRRTGGPWHHPRPAGVEMGWTPRPSAPPRTAFVDGCHRPQPGRRAPGTERRVARIRPLNAQARHASRVIAEQPHRCRLIEESYPWSRTDETSLRVFCVFWPRPRGSGPACDAVGRAGGRSERRYELGRDARRRGLRGLVGAPTALVFLLVRPHLRWPAPWAGVAGCSVCFVAAAAFPPPAAQSALAGTPDTPALTALTFLVVIVGWMVGVDCLWTQLAARRHRSPGGR